MHRPERLDGTIVRVRAHAKSLPVALSQSFLPLFTALLAAQFRPIFRELACRFLASERVEPARKSIHVQSMSTAIRPARYAAALPGLDANRPPFAPGFVLEMFWPPPEIFQCSRGPKMEREHTLEESRRTRTFTPEDDRLRGQDKARFRCRNFVPKFLSAHCFRSVSDVPSR
jgi:hypothetical protein